MRGRIVLAFVCLSLVFAPALIAQVEPKDRVARLMEELTGAPGPSGFEGPVREILAREFRAAGAEVSTDGLGSVIAILRGSAERPRIMLAAHMDEVGLLVRYIMPEGFIKFQTLGGWLDQALVGQRWVILTRKGPVRAVSGLMSPHITPREQAARVLPSNEIFLDVGARSQEEATALGIRPGDPIVPWSPFAVLGNNRYAAKAIDDRVGCVMLVETLRRLKEQGTKLPNTLYFVGTVQEEVGLRGARTASQSIKPDLGIAVEGGIAADHPGGRPEQAQERLGAGPAIWLYDSMMLPNLKLRDFFLDVAAEKNIPLQTQVISGAAMDSAEIQRFATGTPAISLTVPARYLHSHTGLIDRADLDRAVDLLIEILSRLDAKAVGDFTRF
jgi:putative aminopeptidase FrvX